MRKKIGTILEEGLLNKAKHKAHTQHVTFSQLLEEALAEYLAKGVASPQRFSTVEASFGAIPLAPKSLRKIAKEDLYETE